MTVRIAVVGGTGRFGSAIARAVADAGHHTIIGSRSAERACNMAAFLGAQTQAGAAVEGALNADAVRAAEVAVLAVPATGHADILRAVAQAGRARVFVDTCVCHHPRRTGVWQAPAEGSAAERARRLLPRSAAVASALHCVPAAALRDPAHMPAGHVPYCADGEGAADAASALLDLLGLESVHAGGLHASGALEHLAVLLGALADVQGILPGVRFLGLERKAPGGKDPVAHSGPRP